MANDLVTRLPNARLCDPERIGYVMRRTLWRGRDYQDVKLWRELTRRQVARAGRKATAIVPMTVTDPEVFEAVTDNARVFLLSATEAVLRERIAGSDEATEWRSSQLNRCLNAFDSAAFGEPVETDGLTPSEIAAVIAQRLNAAS